MPRPSKIWLITDTHFYDEKLAEICNRPPDFTTLIAKNLKYFVASQDILLHLGDVIYTNFSNLSSLLPTCKSKILVRGNHDKKTDNWYLHNGFDMICESLVLKDVAFSHKPLKIMPDGVAINIHGHFHNFDFMARDPECATYHNPKIHKLLALEYVNYKPIEFKEKNGFLHKKVVR